MFYSRDEKLSLLSEMIQFAKADNNFKEMEYNFIYNKLRNVTANNNTVLYMLTCNLHKIFK